MMVFLKSQSATHSKASTITRKAWENDRSGNGRAKNRGLRRADKITVADLRRLRRRRSGLHRELGDGQCHAVGTRTMATAGATVPAGGGIVVAVVGHRDCAVVGGLDTDGRAGDGNAAQPIGDATGRQHGFAQHHQSKQPYARRKATT